MQARLELTRWLRLSAFYFSQKILLNFWPGIATPLGWAVT